MSGSDVNPLLENDSLLFFFARVFHLSPFGFALFGFVSLPVVLFLWSGDSGTLRSNGKGVAPGQGLLSWINAYILLFPVLDYAIFSYYEAYAAKIPDLIKTNILIGPASDLFIFFTGGGAKWTSRAIVVACLFVAGVAVWWPRISKRPDGTATWLFMGGKPRLLSYYFYVVLFGVHGSIAINWLLRHVVIWRALNRSLNKSVVVYSPDKMFGLSALGDLIWNSYAVMLIVTIIIAAWLIGAKLTNRHDQFQKHPGELAAVILLLVLGPLGVMAPLLGSHSLMKATKENHEAQLISKIGAVSDEVLTIGSGTLRTNDVLTSRVAVLNATSQLYKFIEDCSTWPISPEMVSAFLAFLNPVLLLLLKKFVPGVPEI